MIKKIVYGAIGIVGALGVYALIGSPLGAIPLDLGVFSGWALAIGGLNWGIVAIADKDLLELLKVK